MATRWELVQEALLAAQDRMYGVSQEHWPPGAEPNEKLTEIEPITRLKDIPPVESEALHHVFARVVNTELAERFAYDAFVTDTKTMPLSPDKVQLATASNLFWMVVGSGGKPKS